jgi:NTP pyrophosphatase (non-canonical NTP hydrolase)
MKMPRDGKQSIQAEVARLVAEQGCRKGWTPEQFIARQVCKLAEEVGELAQHVDLPGRLGPLIASTGTIARWTFDQEEMWRKYGTLCTSHALMTELVDIQVVVFCLAEELARLTGEDFDVVERALVNVAADTMRGKRR